MFIAPPQQIIALRQECHVYACIFFAGAEMWIGPNIALLKVCRRRTN
jgi:hypothetical protein